MDPPTPSESEEPLASLDAKPWIDKFHYAIESAVPILYRDLPARFPINAVPNVAAASARILRAARHMMLLCGFISKDDLRSRGSASSIRGRPPRAIAEWRDVWTHPEFYRQLYERWLGPVYSQRTTEVEAASDRSQELSHRGERSGHVEVGVSRGIGGEGAESLAPYRHPPPERFGHLTREVSIDESRVAAQRYEYLQKTRNLQDVPTTVIRLVTVEWYLRGFLPSVMLWAHLALVEEPRVQERPLAEHYAFYMSLGDIIAKIYDPNTGERRRADGKDHVHLGSELLACAEELEKLVGVVRQDEIAPIVRGATPDTATTMVPDMIRVPQELWAAFYQRWQGAERDTIEIRGLSGIQRWNVIEGFDADVLVTRSGPIQGQLLKWTPAHQAPASRYVEGQPDPIEPVVRGVAYLIGLERIHNASAADYPAERYVSLPDPPDPVPALYIPWTHTVRVTPQRTVEFIMALKSVWVLEVADVGICCMETGLAIEQWGSCWSEMQRQAHRKMPSMETIAADIRAGQSVRGWDIMDDRSAFGGSTVESEDAPLLRRCGLIGIMIFDPTGPMGDGHRLYRKEPPRGAAPISYYAGRPNYWTRPPVRWWLRLDRMRTTELLFINSQRTPDPLNRWEDSGIEMPRELVRNLLHDRPLRIVNSAHVNKLPVPPKPDRVRSYTDPYQRYLHHLLMVHAPWRIRRRFWEPTWIAPWPISLDTRNVDLSLLDPTCIAMTPVLRHFRIAESIVPRATWFQDLLRYPTAYDRPIPLAIAPDRWIALLNEARTYPSLMPTARATLATLRLDSVRAIEATTMSSDDLLPGVPLPARTHIESITSANITDFRHYPNLILTSFVDTTITDIPRGLLDLWISGSYSIPAIRPHAGRIKAPPHRSLMCDLSTNRIARFSDSTWLSLIFLCKTRTERATRLARDLQIPPSEAYKYLSVIVINLWGNPIVGSLTGPHRRPRDDDDDSNRWRALIANELDALADRHKRGTMDIPPSTKRRLADFHAKIVVHWAKYRSTVLDFLMEMFVIVHPITFRNKALEIVERIDDLRYLWMI